MIKDSLSGQSTSVSVYVNGGGSSGGGQVPMSVSRGSISIGAGGTGSFTVTCNSPYQLSVDSGNYNVAYADATVTGANTVSVTVYAISSGTTMITVQDPTTRETRNITVSVSGGSSSGGDGPIYYDPDDWWLY